MKNLVILALAVVFLSPSFVDAQACRGFATSGTNVAPTMVRGDWAGMAGATFDAYGGVASRAFNGRYNGGLSFFTGTMSPPENGSEPAAMGGELVVSRSMVPTHVNQQVICFNLGVAGQNVEDQNTELSVPASLSFGVEMDGGWFSLTPHGLVGTRVVFDDGVEPRLDVGFGLMARLGPVITGASLVKQGVRDQQRGILHAGVRF
jgi:hypothetical protein